MAVDAARLIRWDERLTVGDGQTDSEHRNLVDLINDFHEALSGGLGKDVHGILGELEHHTQLHFAEEEERMLSLGYPGYAEHKEDHHTLLQHVKSL